MIDIHQQQLKRELAKQTKIKAMLCYEQQLGANHPSTASSLLNLAAIQRATSIYTQTALRGLELIQKAR